MKNNMFGFAGIFFFVTCGMIIATLFYHSAGLLTFDPQYRTFEKEDQLADKIIVVIGHSPLETYKLRGAEYVNGRFVYYYKDREEALEVERDLINRLDFTTGN